MSILLHFSVAFSFSLSIIAGTFSSENSDHSYFFYQQPQYPRDCREANELCKAKNVSGVLLIKPDGYHEPFEVYCDNGVDSSGWTVIQRRQDGSLSFQRNWLEYKLGFGFLSQEFWLGNEKLSFLTNQKAYELLINITYSDGSSGYVLYNLFRIGDEFSSYKLTLLGLYSGKIDFAMCSTNREYRNYTCERSCENPEVCVSTGSEDEACVCPDGFYTNGENCVPQEECGCFIDGNVIPEGKFQVNSDCSSRCNCSAGQLICNDHYQCSSNAVCEERNNLRQCYCNLGFTGNGVECTYTSPPTDCLDVFNRGNTSNGVYNIKPNTWNGSPFEVYCNMTDGGGWTVFQRRVESGSVDFFLYWDDYKNGFGSPDSELWLGNEKIFSLTNQRRYQLRIDFVNRYGNPYFAIYDFFRINNEANNYRLTVGSYSGGDAGDSLITDHNNQDFSTRDRDNDGRSNHVASSTSNGAWWWGTAGGDSDLNPNSNGDIYWGTIPGTDHIKFTEMKIRPV